MVRRRIFYEEIRSVGTFQDGRIKLDLHFKSDSGDDLVWTPPWKAVVDLVAASKYVEETNRPNSEYNEELSKAYSIIKEKGELSKDIQEVSWWVANKLGEVRGSKNLEYIFPAIKFEGRNKTDKVYELLTGVSTFDEFFDRLELLIDNHRIVFTPDSIFVGDSAVRRRFNEKLGELGLKIDDRINLRKE